MSIKNVDPYQEKKYDILFWRNGTAGTGSQALAIKDKKDDEICIKSWMNNGQLWGCVKPEKLLKMLSNNKGLYEILTNYPYKVFFDIDKKGDDVIF